MRRIDFLWVLVILSAFSCSDGEDGANLNLVGSWQATWQITDSNSMFVESLSGNFVFHNDGSLSVTAYGYTGNLLASDTLSNISKYKIEASKIFVTGPENEIISYEILYQSSELVELLFFDDIRITLKRDL